LLLLAGQDLPRYSFNTWPVFLAYTGQTGAARQMPPRHPREASLLISQLLPARCERMARFPSLVSGHVRPTV